MKKIGTAIYTHVSGYSNIPAGELELLKLATKILLDAGMMLEYLACTIYKIDKKNQKVSFIMSNDFDTAREPEVGDAYCVDLGTAEIKTIKAKGQIYHHKWMFVPDDYKGFIIEESKSWSETWRAKFPQDRKISSRIGYRKYWNEYLEQFGLEIEK